MSDRMTNVEIEDVLSSIRRLVSDDPRPQRPPPAPPGNTCLVLTPAFRVAPPRPGAAPAGAAPPTSTPRDTAPPVPDTLEARIAELEAMLSARATEFEPDEGDRFPAAMSRPVTMPGAAPRPAPPQDKARVAPDPAPRAAEPAEDWHEPVKAAPQRPQPAPEPAATAADGFAGSFNPADPTGAFDGLSTDIDELIDEEMLRDLVRDILREELQGTLGERITRNIRKLVRAEIARAIASRDYS